MGDDLMERTRLCSLVAENKRSRVFVVPSEGGSVGHADSVTKELVHRS